MRYAAAVDGNHAEIVNGLWQCGLHVVNLSRVGHGVPDILVTGHRRQTGQTETLLVEIKTAKGKLTPAEVEFHSEFPPDGPLIVARSLDAILAWFGMI